MNIIKIREHLAAIEALLAEALLAEADAPGAPPAGEDPTAYLRRKIVAVAMSEMGVREDPPGSNDGLKIDQYMGSLRDQGLPWCAGFVSWVIREALLREHAFPPYVMRASAEKIRQWARENSAVVESPQPGDVFVMPRKGGSGHVGFVARSVTPDGLFGTVEGNINSRVVLQIRNLAECDMFVRVV